MEMAGEPEIGDIGDHLSLSGGFLDPEIPFSSVHDLLPSNSHVDFTAFDIFSFESRELPPTWRMDTSSSTDSLSDNSAPMLITEDNGIPSMLQGSSAPCTSSQARALMPRVVVAILNYRVQLTLSCP
jgi:hypothetical protein